MKMFFLFISLISYQVIIAQNVGIGTTSPHASGLLHIDLGTSTTKGLLVTGTYNGAVSTLPDLGSGSRLMFYPGKGAFRAGIVSSNQWNDGNVGNISTAFGESTTASGYLAFALGSNTIASAPMSLAMGNMTKASGSQSVAMGSLTEASGSHACAMGQNSIASGFNSFSFGTNTRATGNFTLSAGRGSVARSYASTAIGMFNDSVSTSSGSSPVEDEPLFIIGNGNSDNDRSNAIVVLKNGNSGIGTNAPATRLHIANDNVDDGGWQQGIMIENISPLGDVGEAGLSFRNASIPSLRQWIIGLNQNPALAFSYGPSFTSGNTRMVIDSFGNVGIGITTPSQKLHVIGNICATGTIGACSDIRYKTNLQPLSDVLSSLRHITPIYYYWKNGFIEQNFTTEKQLGFSAQEIEKFFPEIVQTNNEGYKAVDYGRMTPVLVQAVKEQQEQIDELKGENKALLQKNQTLEARLEKLEKFLSDKHHLLGKQ